MNKQSLLVLEDVESRIAWLHEKTSATNIFWVKSVDEFKAYVEKTPPDDISMIILDHDLGPDKGIHAARFISESFNKIPVIVWSTNLSGSISMVETLKSKGFIAIHIPFVENSLDNLKNVINGWYRNEI